MRRYIFKINLNISDDEDIEKFISGLDQYLCLGNLIPGSQFSFCLGVIDFVIDDIPVALALYMVNDSITQPWVRFGGYDINIDKNNFKDQLFNTAKELLYAKT